MVNLTIDEKKVSVPEGTTILKAAETLGIHIPTLCYHPKLSPIGACRVCLVEVEGEDRPVASCDTPVREGMVVRANTEELVRQREQILQLMLLHHPLDCPVCDKAGECEVQDITVAMGILEQRFSSVKPEKTKEELSPVLDLWHSRCVMCGRCVQICKEIQAARAIDYVVRSGFASKVGPTEYDGYPCESCGQCLSVCPVGAILDSTFLYSARAWQMTKVDSVCTFCGVGCSYELNVRENRAYRVTVRDSQGINKGNLCSVGRFGRDIIHSESRLTSPAVRRNGSLENVGWDEALRYTAQRLKDIVAGAGENSVAGLASARCSNEALFAFQSLMREGLATNRLDTPAHLNNLAVIQTMTDVYGVPAPTATLSDIDDADVILVVDSNIISTHPVAALEVLRVHRSGSSKVLVLGHRSNKLTTQCTQFARTTPGSEVALLNCLANLLIEKGSPNEAALESGSEGYDKLKLHVAKYPLRETAARTGTDLTIIAEIAEAIAGAKRFLLVLSPGSMHSAMNSSIARAAVNLAVLKGGKVLSLLREGNALGTQDMGISRDFLPGYKEAAATQNGPLALYDIFHAVESGGVKALYLMGGDIRREMALLGFPLATLQTLECLVVQDIFGGPVAEMAHVVLPACSSAEVKGSYTSASRVVQNNAQAIEPIGQCRPDFRILSELARELGLPLPDSMDEIRKQIASTVPIYGSVAEMPRQPSAGAWDYSKVASGVRHKLSLSTESRVESDEAYPYIVTFDNMLHFGGTASLHSPAMARIRMDGVAEVSERVEIRIKGGGSATVPACVSRELPAGVISIPAHDLELVQTLISKLELSTFRPEESAPVWLAGVSVAKD
jgi:predicted molibdopterin-dependent oxidoreductase YjgC